MILRIARMLGYTIPMSWTECIEWSRVAYDLFVRRLSFPLRTLLCLNRNGLWANHLSKTRAPLGTIQGYDYEYTDFCRSMLLKRRSSVSDQLRFFIYTVLVVNLIQSSNLRPYHVHLTSAESREAVH